MTNLYSKDTYYYNSIEQPPCTETYTIEKIKEKLGFKALVMRRQFDEKGNETQWSSHWDKDRRIRISMHDSIIEKINSNLNIPTLQLSKESIIKNANNKYYIHYIVSDNSKEV